MADTVARTRTRRYETKWQRFIRLAKRAGRKFIRRNMAKIVFIGLPLAGMLVGLFIGIKIMEYSQSTKLNDYGRQLTYTTYTVESGDTVWDIASDLIVLNPEYNDIRQYVAVIERANKIYDGNIKAGQIIYIPYYINADGTTCSEILEKYGIGK